MSDLRVERAGYGDTRRIVREDGSVVALALMLMNGKWGAFDGDEKRLTVEQFKTPLAVRAWLQQRERDAGTTAKEDSE